MQSARCLLISQRYLLLHYQGIASETSIYFFQSMWHYNAEDSGLNVAQKVNLHFRICMTGCVRLVGARFLTICSTGIRK
jgi:hypothetical protein